MSGESERLLSRGGASPGNFPVRIGNHRQAELQALVSNFSPSRLIIISDSQVAELWGERVENWFQRACNFIVVPAGEKYKNLDSVQHVWKQMKRLECDRQTLVLCLGGGMICDLGGFCASTYLRGLSFVHIPTSLLAQVDASIGGKLAINFENAKNLVGGFVSPLAVHIDTQFLETLPEREFISGFAEVIKHAAVLDREYFEWLESLEQPRRMSAQELCRVIERSVFLKQQVVDQDYRETGLRAILNFGHSFGHALETLALLRGKVLLHGEAVAWGMLLEVSLAEFMGMIKSDSTLRLKQVLLAYGLLQPLDFQPSSEDIIAALAFDKKKQLGELNWTLLNEIGQGKIGVRCEADRLKKFCDSKLELLSGKV